MITAQRVLDSMKLAARTEPRGHSSKTNKLLINGHPGTLVGRTLHHLGVSPANMTVWDNVLQTYCDLVEGWEPKLGEHLGQIGQPGQFDDEAARIIDEAMTLQAKGHTWIFVYLDVYANHIMRSFSSMPQQHPDL